jgi:hypothetical protein
VSESIVLTFMKLVTPKVRANHQLLLNKASDVGLLNIQVRLKK